MKESPGLLAVFLAWCTLCQIFTHLAPSHSQASNQNSQLFRDLPWHPTQSNFHSTCHILRHSRAQWLRGLWVQICHYSLNGMLFLTQVTSLCLYALICNNDDNTFPEEFWWGLNVTPKSAQSSVWHKDSVLATMIHEGHQHLCWPRKGAKTEQPAIPLTLLTTVTCTAMEWGGWHRGGIHYQQNRVGKPDQRGLNRVWV